MISLAIVFWVLAIVVGSCTTPAHAQLISQSLIETPYPLGVRLTLLASNNPRGAGGNLDCPFNQDQARVEDLWGNLTERTLTIRSIHLWIGAYAGNSYDVGSGVSRSSDGSVLYATNWDRYAEPTTFSDKEYTFDPGITLAPHDTLVVVSWCVAFGHAGSQASVRNTIRFVPQ